MNSAACRVAFMLSLNTSLYCIYTQWSRIITAAQPVIGDMRATCGRAVVNNSIPTNKSNVL